MKKLTNKKGFTLMEMLVVIAIIAILVTILVPAISSSLRKAKEATDVANLRAAYAQYQLAMIDGRIGTTIAVNENSVRVEVRDPYMGDVEVAFEAPLNYGEGKCASIRHEGIGTGNEQLVISYAPKEINNGNVYVWKLTVLP